MSAIGPGDFVECVDDRPDEWGEGERPPTLRAVYRIAKIFNSFRPNGDSAPAFRLDRDNPASPHDAWGAFRFRLIYRPSASLIEGLLKPIDEDADASGRVPERASQTIGQG